ncbi:hypothetical protein ABFX02_14G279300 [Erythranthe guttata]
MSMAGVDIAEAHFLRKLHKNKTETEETCEQKSTQPKSLISSKAESATSIGCFSRIFKKIHPSVPKKKQKKSTTQHK